MLYSISGSNAYRRDLASRAIDFAGNRLKFPAKTRVDILLLNARLEDEALGYCHYQSKVGRYQYIEIEVYAKQTDKELVATIFHELKHAEQFALGDLDRAGMAWKGKDYSFSEAYTSLPWEILARGFEERALRAWLKSNKK